MIEQLLLTYSPKRFGELTDLVLEYQQTQNQLLLKEIHRKSEGLVWGVIKFYNIFWFPQVVLEDIVDDCRSFVLVKSVDRYSPDKGAKFETFYTWWLRSHVLSRKGYYLRRQNVMLTPSINDLTVEECIEDKSEKKEEEIFS